MIPYCTSHDFPPGPSSKLFYWVFQIFHRAFVSIADIRSYGMESNAVFLKHFECFPCSQPPFKTGSFPSLPTNEFQSTDSCVVDIFRKVILRVYFLTTLLVSSLLTWFSPRMGPGDKNISKLNGNLMRTSVLPPLSF